MGKRFTGGIVRRILEKMPAKRHQRSGDISGKVKFIYTNIGRGHPFYLDGIHEALIQKKGLAIVRDRTDVFELSAKTSFRRKKQRLPTLQLSVELFRSTEHSGHYHFYLGVFGCVVKAPHQRGAGR